LLPHAPLRHWPEQQSASTWQPAPSRLHVTAGPQAPGHPLQWWLQQSAPNEQTVPSAKHGAVQTATPLAPTAQVPRQQSESTWQTLPTGRQGPGPKTQRLLVASQAPQQLLGAPSTSWGEHDSPVAKQAACESSDLSRH
jgi:hypothetical protein